MQNELKNRREFFKEAAKKTLPILGMAIMSVAVPTMIQSCTKETNCKDVCTNACKITCQTSCVGQCQYQCTGSCKGSCDYGCKTTCKTTCSKAVR